MTSGFTYRETNADASLASLLHFSLTQVGFRTTQVATIKGNFETYEPTYFFRQLADTRALDSLRMVTCLEVLFSLAREWLARQLQKNKHMF